MATPPKNRSQTVTAKMAGQIKWLYQNTHLNQAQIASKFDINQGRVSEIVNEAKFASVAPQPVTDWTAA